MKTKKLPHFLITCWEIPISTSLGIDVCTCEGSFIPAGQSSKPMSHLLWKQGHHVSPLSSLPSWSLPSFPCTPSSSSFLTAKIPQLGSPTPSCLLSQAPLLSFPFTATGWQESNIGPAPLAIFLAESSCLCLSYYRWKTKTNKPFLNSSHVLLPTSVKDMRSGAIRPGFKARLSPVLALRIGFISLSGKLG